MKLLLISLFVFSSAQVAVAGDGSQPRNSGSPAGVVVKGPGGVIFDPNNPTGGDHSQGQIVGTKTGTAAGGIQPPKTTAVWTGGYGDPCSGPGYSGTLSWSCSNCTNGYITCACPTCNKNPY